MGKNNLVSIITPMYNAVKFIEETIQSVLDQTYQNWEMIIVDDCSTDNGVTLIRKYCEKDDRIKFIQLQKNSGGAVARNEAIKSARGKYIAFLDSDDLWHPDKLDKQVRFMEDNDFYFSFSSYNIIDEKSNNVGVFNPNCSKLNYYDLLKTCKIGCLTAMYDSDSLGKVYLPVVKRGQDYALWLKILKKIKFAYCLNDNLASYRIVQGSVSRNKFKKITYQWKIYREFENISLFKSIYYLFHYSLNGFLKYRKK